MTSDLRPRTTGLGPRTSDLGLRFALRADVALEDFGGRALVLLCDALELREINAQARIILGRVDGKRTVDDIAKATGMPTEDVGAALLEMERQRIVRRTARWSKERPEHMDQARYMADPDVSFRPEDDAGGILYNAQTDTLEAINAVAAEIWMFLAVPRTRAEVVAHLIDVCAGAVREQVEADVGEFLEAMRAKGFIGVVEEPV